MLADGPRTNSGLASLITSYLWVISLPKFIGGEEIPDGSLALLKQSLRPKNRAWQHDP